MPKFNADIIMHELHQTLFCDVWIVALNFYLILKWKKLKEFQYGCDTDQYQHCRICISPWDWYGYYMYYKVSCIAYAKTLYLLMKSYICSQIMKWIFISIWIYLFFKIYKFPWTVELHTSIYSQMAYKYILCFLHVR